LKRRIKAYGWDCPDCGEAHTPDDWNEMTLRYIQQEIDTTYTMERMTKIEDSKMDGEVFFICPSCSSFNYNYNHYFNKVYVEVEVESNKEAAKYILEESW
jgi:uncharacterized C2H2 Zn-finger protein